MGITSILVIKTASYYTIETKVDNSTCVMGATKKKYLEVTKKKENAKKQLSVLMDETDGANISQFVTQGDAKGNIAFGDDIEEFMQANRIEKNIEVTEKPKEFKYHYINSTLNLLEHDRQLRILETHAGANTVPVGLKVKIRSTVNLSDELKKEWDATMHSCSQTLLHILTRHYR